MNLGGWSVKRASNSGDYGDLSKGRVMANSKNQTVTIEELLVSGLAQTDALAKLLIEKGVISQQEFTQKISEERAIYQRMLNPTEH
jgi:hypothetical protein